MLAAVPIWLDDLVVHTRANDWSSFETQFSSFWICQYFFWNPLVEFTISYSSRVWHEFWSDSVSSNLSDPFRLFWLVLKSSLLKRRNPHVRSASTELMPIICAFLQIKQNRSASRRLSFVGPLKFLEPYYARLFAPHNTNQTNFIGKWLHFYLNIVIR